MSQSTLVPTNPLLIIQKNKALQHFMEQHGSVHKILIEQLKSEQFNDFSNALMLSDFVERSAMHAPDIVLKQFISGSVYNEGVPDYSAQLKERLLDCKTEEELHKVIRLYRLEAMVNIAVADLVLDVPLTLSLARLTQLADSLILSALHWLTAFCHEKWGVPTNSSGEEMPLLVYGMGKLGGRELNFSSDIDLIFAYPKSGDTHGARRSIDNQQFFTRLAQKLISSLHQQTVDGFAYRVDMRLRPFGDSGPLVLSFSAMEDYYQEQGRDWERYAMLKARLIGEGKYHKQLSRMLRPFIYRRYIDFSVIDSLRRMKMMIRQEVRRKQLVNNIKLGAGGIREVEFIVQVFQLIRGGRIEELQRRNLMSVLPLLVEHQVLHKPSADILMNAYCFLRRVENIIQAFDDKQTQTLPDNSLDQARLLQVLNIANWLDFQDELAKHMTNVHHEFIALIGEDNPNTHDINEQWVTLWMSRWDDEESIEWVEQIVPTWSGKEVWFALSEFRQFVEKCSIGSRGRLVLDKLMPLLMTHVEALKSNTRVIPSLLTVFKKIATRTAYLELLFENEGALIHLIKLCDKSEWVSEHIAKYPILLDELIDPKLLHNPPVLSSYAEELRQIMLRVPEDDVEMQMETLRQFKQAQQLRIAAADIVGVLPLMKVSDHLTVLAEAIVTEVIELAWQSLSVRYGVPNSTLGTDHKGFAVIGYGKVGGIELGYGSDLDVVFIHQSDLSEMTSGERSVPASQFYAKLAQKIMHIFNTRMTSGILYEIDMRLRPSGNSGILMTHVDSFYEYQLKEAWTWEHQALVRTRTIYGHESIVNQFNVYRQNILCLEREPKKLATDVIEMRDKMRKHLDTSNDEFANIKQGNGGLVDIEFLAQFLVLRYAAKNPKLTMYSDNIRIFERLCAANFIEEEHMSILIDSYCELRNYTHIATLQNKEALLDAPEFKDISNKITQLFEQYLSV